MNTRHLPALLIAIGLLVGCGGPTHTSGTKGFAAKELAVLSIPQLPSEAHVQIHSVQFDGAGDKYGISGGRDFYLPPGAHTGTFTLTAHLPKVSGPLGLLMPKGGITIPGPKDLPLGLVTAGKEYELAPNLDSFDPDKLADGGAGGLTLVREKEKLK